MNINKLTRAELISKIQELENQKSKTIEKSVDKKINDNKKINDKKITVDNKSTLLYDIFLKIKTLILSLSIIAILSQVFKNYKTIRVILKVANYVIVTMFGLSIFDAFGLGFITKFLGELKFILGSIVTYLRDSSFYSYLGKIFSVIKEDESVRSTYKKPVEIDWKAEFEKADRQREIDKWKERYAQDKEDGFDKKTLLILLLILGGSVGAWYYGKEALDIISPLYNISNVIKKILRGGTNDDGDDDDNNNNIQLDPDSRAVSPDMLVYASDMVHPKLNEHLPPAPPAPPMPNDPPAHTEQGPPNSLLDQIKRGKSLKKAITKESSNEFAGKEVNKVASSSKLSLTDKLSNRLDIIRSVVTGDEEEIMDDIGGWDDNSETTPTQSLIKDKGKAKFLEAITRDDEKIMPPSKIANILSDIVKKYPNLSQETLEKLSTVEGLKNRAQIIESLSEDELKTNMSLKEIKDMSKQEEIKMDKIIKSTLNLDSEKIVEKLNTEFPDYNFDVNSYKELFMKGTEEEINSGKTLAERDRIRKEILDTDLLEIQNTGGTSNIREIRNVIRENYTHNNLLNEIKNVKKPNFESIDDLKILEVEKEIYAHPSEFKDVLEKAKNLQSLEDLAQKDKEKIELESLKIQPDKLIDELKNRSDYAEDSYIDSIITENIDNNLKELITANPQLSKQQLIETLIQNNPENKNKILSIVNKTMNEQLNYLKHKFSEKDFNKIKKVLEREDLKELQSLSENRSTDQIRSLVSVNQSHINLLHEIKIKASLASLRKEANEKIKASNENTSSSMDQIDNTMNLFD